MAAPGHPAAFLEQAQDDARRATILIQKLTSSKEEMKEELPKGTDTMPPAELCFCSGLAFTFVRKGGMGVSVETGHGFVVKKIAEPSTSEAAAAGRPGWSWSPPLFISVFAGGVGLTFGYSEIESVVVLDTPEAVQGFTHGQTTLDTDITGAAGSSVAAHLPATAVNLSNPSLSDKSFSFSVAHGAIVDISLTGLHYSVHDKMNAAFYDGASPQSVLDGGVEAPPAFREVYDALDKALETYYAALSEGAAEPAALPLHTATAGADGGEVGEGEIAPVRGAAEPAGPAPASVRARAVAS